MTLRRLAKDASGASAAEFGLVLPLLILLLFGIIDAGRFMWSINRAEKAAQMGVRMAVLTDNLSTAVGANYANTSCGGTVIQPGDTIPPSCFTNVSCNNMGCNPGGSVTGYGTKFNAIVGKMDAFMREIDASKVTIEYSQSGLGYAGDPNGPDVAPIVTVRLSGLPFQPMMLLGLVNIGLPEIRTSLTFEDGVGTQSN